MEKEQCESEALSDIDVVAYDEAGHVIVAYVLKRLINGVRFELNVKGTYNACTIQYPYSPQPNDLMPPYVDPNVPYDQIAISLPDEVTIRGIISAAGKAGVMLLYRQKGVSEHLATMGMEDARIIINSMREENIQLHDRKRIFRDFESRALHIVSFSDCTVALEQVAALFRKKMLCARDDELNGFAVGGLELMTMIGHVFTNARDI